MERLPFSFAKHYGVLLASQDKTQATLHYRSGLAAETVVELRRVLEKPLQLQEVSASVFDEQLTQHYEADSSLAMQMVETMGEELDLHRLVEAIPEAEDLLATDNDAPIIRLLNAVLTQAIRQNASDIHVETFAERLVVRFRVDGVLHTVLEPERVLAPLVVSRLKVMAKLDIAEKRLPQDGRISLVIAGRGVDVRVSTMPSQHGERVVLRLLDKQAACLDLTGLGLTDAMLEQLHTALAQSHGVILVTGPTGSGKTTTLYSALTALNDVSRNILTVEDPVEYDLPGIGQTQVNSKIDMTFAKGLRAILRQDPDVVMIGEIRDQETAKIAVQASLTGHLVFSTLHTNSAVGAVTRLRDMGVEAFLLSSSVIALIAQRLVRVLCTQCKQAVVATETERAALKVDTKDTVHIYHSKGCETCNNKGFVGRSGIYELILVDDTLRKMIHDGTEEQEMERWVRRASPSMFEDGCRRVLAGETTLQEVLRVTQAS